MAGSVSHRALDGSELVLSVSGGMNLSMSASSVARWMVDGREWEFTAGGLTLGEAFAADSGVAFTQVYSMQGESLHVGFGENEIADPQYGFHLTTDLTIGAWFGRRYSIATYAPVRFDGMVELFGRFRFIETPSGLRMVPTGLGVEPSQTAAVTVMKEIPGLGLLITHAMTDADAQRIPAWAGAPTANGESYCDEGEDGVPVFRIATPRTFSMLLPDPADLAGVDEQQRHRATRAVADRLADLTVDWAPARIDALP